MILSPPYQKFSFATPTLSRDTYKDHIEELRYKANVPYIIENVVGAPLLEPLMLCGTMMHTEEGLASVSMLKVFRHRLFESNVPLSAPGPCKHQGHEAKKRRNDNGDFFTVAGVGTCAEKQWVLIG